VTNTAARARAARRPSAVLSDTLSLNGRAVYRRTGNWTRVVTAWRSSTWCSFCLVVLLIVSTWVLLFNSDYKSTNYSINLGFIKLPTVGPPERCWMESSPKNSQKKDLVNRWSLSPNESEMTTRQMSHRFEFLGRQPGKPCWRRWSTWSEALHDTAFFLSFSVQVLYCLFRPVALLRYSQWLISQSIGLTCFVNIATSCVWFLFGRSLCSIRRGAWSEIELWFLLVTWLYLTGLLFCTGNLYFVQAQWRSQS